MISKPRGPKIVRSVQPQRLGRRLFLRGTVAGLGVTIGTPVLDIMLNNGGNALAQGGTLPVRFGVFTWGGGITHSMWNLGSGSLSDMGGDLAPYATLIRGVSHIGSSPGHIPSRGIVLSASHDLTKCVGDCVGTYRGQNMPEPSLDVIVKNAWKGKTRRDWLGVAISTKGPYSRNTSWEAGGRTYNKQTLLPASLWNDMFKDAVTSTNPAPIVETTLKYERSMLDAVINDAKSLNLRLGQVDRDRMDNHLSGLRDLEMRLQAREAMPADQTTAGGTTQSSATCTTGAPPPTKTFGEGTSKEEKGPKSELMSDVLVAGLSCDISRVFSYEWSAGQSQAVYWETGSNEEHHEFNHRAAQGTDYGKTIGFAMKHLAYLARKLKNTTEGGGNLLDRTLIFATSEHANAGGHNYTDHPFLFLGKAGGGFKAPGKTIKGSGNVGASVLLAAVRAVGVPLPKIGASGRDASTPFPGLV